MSNLYDRSQRAKKRRKQRLPKNYWSARKGLGEWTPEDKKEVEARTAGVLAERFGIPVECLAGAIAGAFE